MNGRRVFNIACHFVSLLLPLWVQAQFNYTTNGGAVTITGYTGTNGIVTIPSTLVGLPVTTIASFAFYQKTVLTNVTIPNSVANIGSSAFFNCSRMTNIALGTNVSTIGTAAFQWCSGLADVVLPNSVTNIGTSVFANCANLNRITLGSNLTAIGSSAFADCSSLTNITIPNGVKSIGSQAFYRCFSLLSVVLSDTVTNIGTSVFANCTNLNRVTFGSNLTAIGSSAFADCSSLTNTTFPNGVKNIGSQAFYRCFSLLSVVLSDNVTSIGSRAFASCANLRSVAFGTNVSTIGSQAFQSCSSLTNVTLPDSVTSLGDYAFSLCTNLAYIAIGTNIASIGNYAFQQCVSLVQFTIPASVTNIGAFAFANCVKLTEIAVAPNNPAYVSVAGVLFNRNQTALIQYPIAKTAQTYTIPNTVTDIPDGAFQGCASLASVAIPDGLSRIPNNAFRGCAALTSISIPDRVTDVGNSAFLGCSSLTNATIGNSVTNIHASAFSGCSNLTSVSMGYIVYTIGNEAFRDCTSLAVIYFYGDFPYYTSVNAFTNAPATAYYLPGAAHWSTWSTNLAGLPTAVWIPFTYATNNNGVIITGCTDRFLSAITISNSITGLPVVGIEEHAFNRCNKLVSITIPDSVIHLGSHAFAGCTNLIDIYFEGNVPTADLPVFGDAPKATVYYRPGMTGWSSAFDGLPTALWIKFNRGVHDGMVEIGPYTDTVSDVVIPRTIRGLPVTGIGVQAFRFLPITSIVIPDGVTYITTGAFDSCGQLTSVTLPSSLTSISWAMSPNCGNLTNITIPASVRSIWNWAFYGCGLRTVYFEGNAPDFYGGGDDPKMAFAWCPVTAYYLPGTTGWTNFLSLVGIPGQLWDPQIQTDDGSFGVQANQFGFNITGTSNLALVVEASTNTSNPVWTRLQTNTLTGAPLYFSDPQWTNYGSRFYRLRWP